MSQSRKKVAFILNAFPTLSETFIVNEVLALRKRGLDIDTWSLFEPSDDKENPELKAITESTQYLSPLFRPLEIVKAHILFLFRAPARYLKTLGFALKHRSASGLAFLWRKPQKGKDRQDLLLHFILALPVARWMCENNYTLLHAHFADAAASMAMLVSRLLDIPYSMTMHAFDVFIPQENFVEKFDNAEFIITCTRFNKTYLQEHYPQYNSDKIYVIYHGIDLQKFQRQRQKRQAPPVILAVGRLIPKKGLSVLVYACKLLRQAGYDFECRIVGSGPLRPRLEMLIKLENLVNHVQLVGSIMPSQIVAEYARATLFVLPCMVEESGNRDGIPNVIAEAMAMKLPVISTTVSAIPELVLHKKSGILIPEGDYNELFRQMQQLLNSPSRMKRMGVEGRKQVEQVFDAEKKMNELYHLYQNKLKSLK